MSAILKTLYFLCVTIFIVAILEYQSGVLMKRQMKYELPIFEDILTDNKNVFTIKTNFDYLWGDTIPVHTNHDGYRENFNFQDQDLKVAFMGDSFCFGTGIRVEDRYSNIVAKKLEDEQVYPKNSIAALCYNNGFAIEHYEYFLQLHPLLKPKHLIVNLYLGNDLESDVNETEITRNDNGTIKSLRLPARYTESNTFRNAFDRYAWITWLKKRSDLTALILYRINKSSLREENRNSADRPIPNLSNHLTTEMGQLDEINLRPFTSLAHIKKTMAARGTTLHVLVIPQNFMVGSDKKPHIAKSNLPHMQEIREKKGLIKTTMEQCHKYNVECHDLSLVLHADDYLPNNGHWSVKGNASVASYLENILRR